MVCQKLLKPDTDLPEDLFIRNCRLSEGNIHIDSNSVASFDTYFNIFSSYKWKKYTRINSLNIRIIAKGKGKAAIKGIKGSSVFAVSEIEISSGDFHEYEFDEYILSDDADYIYLEFETSDSELILSDFSFTNNSVRPLDLKFACCFCTYKREAEILKNIRSIRDHIILNADSSLHNSVDIYVADNASTLKLDADDECDRIHIFENKNYGGSGGFTRCIIESLFYSKIPYTHVILMDDDALIKPYVIEKTASFLSVIKPEYSNKMIGGAMFSKEEMHLQVENGASFNLSNGLVTTYGVNKDMRMLENVIDNDFDNIMNYNGWFYSCIPALFVNDKNLPLPMFIHGDDIEYGMRNKAGFINLNGVCIWHPDPRKNCQRVYMSYYDYRARRIIFSEYGTEKNVLSAIIRELGSFVVNSLCYQYDMLWFQYKALLDFYSGIDAFMKLDPEMNNRTIIEKNRDISCNLSDKDFVYSTPVNRGRAATLFHLVINVLIPSFSDRFYPSGTVLWREAVYWGAKRIYYVDESGKGVMHERRISKFLRSIFDSFKVIFLIVRRHNKVFKEWNARIGELESLDFWEKYLSLSGSKD